MSFSQPSSGALPARFRRQRLLIVGCGDVGMRLVRQMQPLPRRLQVMALSRDASQLASLRAAGLRVVWGDLDQPATLQRLAGLAHSVVHLAPPAADPDHWWRDWRTLALVQALRKRGAPSRLVYGSTSGVYGDQCGRWVSETTLLQPHTPRAQRRVDAERLLRHWGRASLGRTRVSILRIPGIYAPDRVGGTPRERLLRHTPVLAKADDVYTNHIHADDLARACWLALWRGKPQRVYNCNDDSSSKMGEYFDMAADLYGLPRLPRIPLRTARNELPLSLLSFMQESRRLHNQRIKRELRLQWRYPTPQQGLQTQHQRPLF